jgi:hypothetical protein
MKEVYGCFSRGYVLSSNEEGRDCSNLSCGYRMLHGKCGYLVMKEDFIEVKESLEEFKRMKGK